MGKVKKDSEWLYDRLKILTELSNQIPRAGEVTEYHDFTALKLTAIHYYAGIFTAIVNSPTQRQWYDGSVYVDLFAGTGLVKLIDSKSYEDFIPGSPSCAALLSNKFDYMICVEEKKDRCEALESRLTSVLDRQKFDVINGDCNKKITEVIALIKKRFKNPILLTFVDPEGLEITFATLKSLSENFNQCDFMVNINAQGAKRVAAKFQKGIDNVKDSLQKYLNADVEVILKELAEGKEPQEQYADLIKDVLGKKMGDIIKIRNEGENIAYYLLGFTRETRGGSRYSKAFSVLESRLKSADRHKVRIELEKIHGRQETL